MMKTYCRWFPDYLKLKVNTLLWSVVVQCVNVLLCWPRRHGTADRIRVEEEKKKKKKKVNTLLANSEIDVEVYNGKAIQPW